MKFALYRCAPLLLLCGTAAAQRAPTTLAQVLARLGAQADTLARSLPSFSCTENVVSQEVRGKKTVRSVAFTATLRAKRGDDGLLVESYEVKTLNGQPFTTGGFSMPTYIEGGFSRALRYFAPGNQGCYIYKLSPDGGRLDFEAAKHLPRGNACTTEGTTGFALLDADGNITHLERTVSLRYALAYREATFAAIDLVPLTLNGTSYPVSRHIVAERPNLTSIDRFDATYSDCKLFSATVTIGPATEPPAAPQ